MKLNLNLVEYLSTETVRGTVVIDTNFYPELNGMSEEEVKEYILYNGYEMKSTTNNESLYDDLSQQDIIHEKTCNDSSDIVFDL